MLDRLADHRRLLNVVGFAICALLLAAAYYLQFVEDMEPCPLCIFQRVALAVLAVVFLLAALQNSRGAGRYVYAALLAATAAVGTAIAGRHIWLQSLPPDQVPSCGPGLNYLLDTFPLFEAVALVLRGSGECAEVDLLFGLSIPLWTLFVFVGLGLAGAVINLAGGSARRA